MKSEWRLKEQEFYELATSYLGILMYLQGDPVERERKAIFDEFGSLEEYWRHRDLFEKARRYGRLEARSFSEYLACRK